MPNYIQNIIEVHGDSDELVKFINRHIKDGYFDFNTIIPEPKYKAETSKKYILQDEDDARDNFLSTQYSEDRDGWFNWYKWRMDHWGTKWNASHNDKICFDTTRIIEENITTIQICFDTAWEPPIPIAKKLIQRYYKKLRIGWDWYSFESMIAGHLSKDNYGDGTIPGFYYCDYKLK